MEGNCNFDLLVCGRCFMATVRTPIIDGQIAQADGGSIVDTSEEIIEVNKVRAEGLYKQDNNYYKW